MAVETLYGTTTNSLFSSPKILAFPNVFLPHGEGINDEFSLFSNGNVFRIQSLAVFKKVIERLDFDPNDSTAFWDGTYKSKEMGVGVFVYYSVVEFRDGSTEVFKVNLTLVR